MASYNADYGYDEDGQPFVTPPPVPSAPAQTIPTYEEFSRAIMAPQPWAEPTGVPPGPAPFAPPQQPFAAPPMAPQVTQTQQMGPRGQVSTTQQRMPSSEEQARTRLLGAQAQKIEQQMSETGIHDTHYEAALQHFGDMRKELILIKSAGGGEGAMAAAMKGDPGYLKRNLTSQMAGLIPYIERVVQSVPKLRTPAMGGPGEIMRLTPEQMTFAYGQAPGGGDYETDESGKHTLLTNIHQPRTSATQAPEPLRSDRTRNLVDSAGATLVGLASQAFPQINIAGDTNKKIVAMESLDDETRINVSMVHTALESWMDKGMFSPGRQKEMASFIRRFSLGGRQLKWSPPGFEAQPTGALDEQPSLKAPASWGAHEPTRKALQFLFGSRPETADYEPDEEAFLGT